MKTKEELDKMTFQEVTFYLSDIWKKPLTQEERKFIWDYWRKRQESA